MAKKAVIFGAGEWGKIAYYYYKEDIEIAYYIDNDETIWGTKVNDVMVCSPEILRHQEYTVIIANKRFAESIKEQLVIDYNIQRAVVFRVDERMQELYLKYDHCSKIDELIVAFSHGLGNQMFQYALYRNFLKQGKNVKADLSAYIKPGMMPFELLKTFPNIKLEYCHPEQKEYFLNETNKVYIEEPPKAGEKLTFKKELLEMEIGYVEGFHCSYRYPELIRKELLEDFCFPYRDDKHLCELRLFLEKEETVGVHIRRGDFQNSRYKREMGGICTEEYYLKAIDCLKRKYPSAFFVFFSNDMEWAKNNIREKNALYVEACMFTNYYDWYDMYLMSICKHNIIPNSTFGWWGAWLNQNPEKTIVAPKRWRNRWDANDWCPLEWILI